MGMVRRQALFCFFLCLSPFFLAACSNQDDTPISQKAELFPSISYKDVFGRKVGASTFKGHYVYVQFIRSWSNALQDEIEGLFSDPQSIDNLVGLFISSERIIVSRNPVHRKNVYFIQDAQHKLRDIFGAPQCCDAYLVYNQLERLMLKGTNHHGSVTEVRPFLLEIRRERDLCYFDSNYKTRKFIDADLPRALLRHSILDGQQYDFLFIALLGNVCTGCSAGVAIHHMNDLYATKPRSLGFLILVSDKYTIIDVENMAKSLNIAVPIKRPSIDIINLWNTLQNGLPLFFDNVFLIIDNRGTLISVLDDRDPASFFEKLENLSKVK